ncbi:MAG: TadE/TadG family type IV pilus assembly protein [Pseudomonadota bacterium]
MAETMKLSNPNQKRDGILRKFRRFGKQKKGVSAIEFALIAPILIIMVLAGVDAVYALSAKRKVIIAASSIADLGAREGEFSDQDIQGLVNLGRTLMVPFNVNASDVIITGLRVRPNGTEAEVLWSDSVPEGLERAVGTTVQLPSEFTPEIFLIQSDVRLPYTTLLPVFRQFTDGEASFTLQDARYFRSRSGQDIPRL